MCVFLDEYEERARRRKDAIACVVHAYFYANNLQIQKIKGEGERDYFNFVYIDADKNAHISHRNSFPKSDTEFVNEFD